MRMKNRLTVEIGICPRRLQMEEITLIVDGKKISLNEFVKSILEHTIRGALHALKDVNPDGEVRITIPGKGK